MPYKISKVNGGFKTVSPNHPGGFSKKPQSKQQAIKQMVAIKIHDKESHGSSKKVGVKKGK